MKWRQATNQVSYLMAALAQLTPYILRFCAISRQTTWRQCNNVSFSCFAAEQAKATAEKGSNLECCHVLYSDGSLVFGARCGKGSRLAVHQ